MGGRWTYLCWGNCYSFWGWMLTQATNHLFSYKHLPNSLTFQSLCFRVINFLFLFSHDFFMSIRSDNFLYDFMNQMQIQHEISILELRGQLILIKWIVLEFIYIVLYQCHDMIWTWHAIFRTDNFLYNLQTWQEPNTQLAGYSCRI
jgi:hypothetical protein